MRGAEIGPSWRVQGRRAPHLHHICRTFFAERGWRTIVFTREGRGPLLARLCWASLATEAGWSQTGRSLELGPRNWPTE